MEADLPVVDMTRAFLEVAVSSETDSGDSNATTDAAPCANGDCSRLVLRVARCNVRVGNGENCVAVRFVMCLLRRVGVGSSEDVGGRA